MGQHSEMKTLLELISTLNEKITQKGITIEKSQYDALIKEVQFLDQNIFSGDAIELGNNSRLEELVDVLSAVGNADYTKEARVTGDCDHLDYIAVSINLMLEHLRANEEENKCISEVFDCFNDIFIIADASGAILHVNADADQKLNIADKNFRNRSVSMFFNNYHLRNKYAIDFVNSVGVHSIIRGYCANETSNIILRVIAKPYGNRGGYCYRIEKHEKPTYSVTPNKPVYVQTGPPVEETEEEKREYLIGMQHILAAKEHLNFSEIKMLNSINQMLNGDINLD